MFSVLVGIVPLPQAATREAEKLHTAVKTAIGQQDIDKNNNEAQSVLECRQWSTTVDEGTPTLLLNFVAQEPLTAEQVVELVQEQAVACFDQDENATTTPVCEMWASAPAPLPLRPAEGYPVIPPKSATTTIAAPGALTKTMKEWGLAVQEQLLDAEQVAELSRHVYAAIDKMEGALAEHRPSIQVGKDDFCFAEMASRSAERFDLLLNNQTSPETVAFVREHILMTGISDNKQRNNNGVQSFLHNVLNVGSLEEYNYDISVVYSRPGAVHQGWHADGDHQPKGSLDAGWQRDGWQTRLASAYAVCLFLPLIELNEEVGYTQFWPASHRHRDLMGFGKVAELAEATWNGTCDAGDGIWYDYRLFHRGMPNQSSSVVRPVLQVLFKKKWYVEKANYGTESIIPSDSTAS